MEATIPTEVIPIWFVEEILDVLRNMDDAMDVICNLDADAVMKRMEGEQNE